MAGCFENKSCRFFEFFLHDFQFIFEVFLVLFLMKNGHGSEKNLDFGDMGVYYVKLSLFYFPRWVFYCGFYCVAIWAGILQIR